MILKENTFLVLYGPTGVGKTDIALTLAEHVPMEIINMDMGQCYTPLTIGTAKPDWRSLATPHHLFDYIHDPHNITVVEYRAACVEIMHQIWARGALPVLVGGSGFYLQSLFFPPLLDEPVMHSFSENDTGALWDQLNAIDAERAKKIHPHDAYRIQRALSIWYATGKKPSEYLPTYNPPSYSYYVDCLTRERQSLYERIDSRTYSMLNQGWINEARVLLGTPWEHFLRSKKIIGYSDIFDYLQGDQSDESKRAMIRAIQQRTRNYAKRQMTFWRKFEKDLTREHSIHEQKLISGSQVAEANLTLLGVDLYIKQLLKKVNTWFA